MVEVSVVVPVFNAEGTLEELTDRLVTTLESTGRRYEIIYVDDASQDSSASVIERIATTSPSSVRVFRSDRNRGQHATLQRGLAESVGEITVTLDDDLQHAPEDLPRLLEAVDEGADLVFGRFENRRPGFWRVQASLLADRFLALLYGLPSGFQFSSYRAVRKNVVSEALVRCGHYRNLTVALLSCSRDRVNVGVSHAERRHGRSNYGPVRLVVFGLQLILSGSRDLTRRLIGA